SVFALSHDGELWQMSSNPKVAAKRLGTGYQDIISSSWHQLALKQDGSLWALGDNSSGQLGTGTADGQDEPALVGTGFSAFAVGETFSLALKADGLMYTWGSDDFGQLGLGRHHPDPAPVRLPGLDEYRFETKPQGPLKN
ncbi:RCC1 domain-containing protein, partial [Parachitinimonas caeni]